MLFSCCVKNNLTFNKIHSIHVLFKSISYDNYEGYKLKNNEIIKFDKNFSYVKLALKKYETSLDSLPSNSLNNFKVFFKKNTTRYLPIKTLPLKEFGYIKTTDNAIFYYGIIGDNVLINLTENIVYID